MTRDQTTREECSPEGSVGGGREGDWEVALLECKWPQKDLGKKEIRKAKQYLYYYNYYHH